MTSISSINITIILLASTLKEYNKVYIIVLFWRLY